MKTTEFFSGFCKSATSNLTKKTVLRMVISILVAFFIVGVSIFIGLKTIIGDDLNRLTVSKFQLVTIATYTCLSGIALAWSCRNQKVSLNESITFVGTPVVLYYLFAGYTSYYASLLLLSIIMVWRALSFQTQELEIP